ncbi:MAG TPA: hypothetical protein HA306_07935 [Methanosarcina sp.]|nr:hypothetical protein [Methanosarcina sp.]
MEIHSSSNIEAVLLPLALYWMILMPAIGVCLLSNATMYTESGNVEEES